jgi:WD40 repeat protein
MGNFNKLEISCLFREKKVFQGKKIRNWRLNLTASFEGQLYLTVENEIQIYHLDENHPIPSNEPIRILKHPSPLNANEGSATDEFPSPINAIRIGEIGPEIYGLLAVDDAGQLIIWFMQNINEEIPPLVFNCGVSAWSVASNGKRRLVAVGSNSHDIYLWNLGVDSKRREARILRGHDNNIPSLDFSSCGLYLASCSIDITFRIWNTENGQCLYCKDICDNYGSSSWGWNINFIDPNVLRVVPSSQYNSPPNLSISGTSLNPLIGSTAGFSTGNEEVVMLEDEMHDNYIEEMEYSSYSNSSGNVSQSTKVSSGYSVEPSHQLLLCSTQRNLYLFDPLTCISSTEHTSLLDVCYDVTINRLSRNPNLYVPPLDPVHPVFEEGGTVIDDSEINERIRRSLSKRTLRVSFSESCKSFPQKSRSFERLSRFGLGTSGLFVFADQGGQAVIVGVRIFEQEDGSLKYKIKEEGWIPLGTSPLSMLSGMFCTYRWDVDPKLSIWRIYLLYNDGSLSCYEVKKPANNLNSQG